MSNQIPVMPLDTLRSRIGEWIEDSKQHKLPLPTVVLMSISEYLKDAERWQHVKDNVVPGYGHMGPDELQKYVDAQLAKAAK